jgi:EmrB/QacA subfamily drug resistance transporter
MLGVFIFGVGSLACSLVDSTGPLIGFRSVTGLGAAFMMPATLSIITSTFTGMERARAIGIWAGVSGIGTAAGPLISGWLLQHFWWGSVFLINVPVAAVALVGALVAVNESRAEYRPHLDVVGVLLSSLGLTALTYGVIVTSTEPWRSPDVIGSFLIAALLLVAFFVWGSRQEHPLLDVHLFANRTFSSALAAVSGCFFAMFAVSYLISQYIQFVQGESPFGVGLRFMPMAVAIVISSNVAARLTGRLGLRSIVVSGMILVTAGLAIFAMVSTTSGFAVVGIPFALLGFGMGLILAPASTAIVGTLRPEKLGAGSGLRSTVQLVSGALGVAVVGSLTTSRYRSQIEHAFSGPLQAVPRGARPAITSQIGQAVTEAGNLNPGLSTATIRAASQAYVSGIRISAVVLVAVMVAATLAAAAYIPGRAQPAADDQARRW